MTARIIDGKAIAEKIRGEIAAEVAEFRRQTQCVPHLAAILVGDDPADVVEGLGRHLVAAQTELGHELFGEQPFARGEDLPQLDVGGSQAFEGTTEPARQPGT